MADGRQQGILGSCSPPVLALWLSVLADLRLFPLQVSVFPLEVHYFEAPLSVKVKGPPHPAFLECLTGVSLVSRNLPSLPRGRFLSPSPSSVSDSLTSPAWASKMSPLEHISAYVVLATHFNGQISSCCCNSPLGCCDDLWAGTRGAVSYLLSLWVTAVPVSLSCSYADFAGLRGAKYSKTQG